MTSWERGNSKKRRSPILELIHESRVPGAMTADLRGRENMVLLAKIVQRAFQIFVVSQPMAASFASNSKLQAENPHLNKKYLYRMLKQMDASVASLTVFKKLIESSIRETKKVSKRAES